MWYLLLEDVVKNPLLHILKSVLDWYCPFLKITAALEILADMYILNHTIQYFIVHLVTYTVFTNLIHFFNQFTNSIYQEFNQTSVALFPLIKCSCIMFKMTEIVFLWPLFPPGGKFGRGILTTRKKGFWSKFIL